jgi:hypothetical protein
VNFTLGLVGRKKKYHKRGDKRKGAEGGDVPAEGGEAQAQSTAEPMQEDGGAVKGGGEKKKRRKKKKQPADELEGWGNPGTAAAAADEASDPEDGPTGKSATAEGADGEGKKAPRARKTPEEQAAARAAAAVAAIARWHREHTLTQRALENIAAACVLGGVDVPWAKDPLSAYIIIG